MNFQEAHRFLIVEAKYRFLGSHLLFFRPDLELRNECYANNPLLKDKLDEAFQAVDQYHDKREREGPSGKILVEP